MHMDISTSEVLRLSFPFIIALLCSGCARSVDSWDDRHGSIRWPSTANVPQDLSGLKMPL